ncbi:MAG: TSUP family transporter, partial [Planctomycetota bacterium]
MGFEPWVFLAIAVLGLVAGTLGGMLGVGGSLIMIPALVMMFGRDGQTEGFNLHLYQAAAMIVNLFVAIPATLRHQQAGAVMGAVMKRMLPVAIVMIFVGVWVSNLEVFREGEDGSGGGTVLLGRVFGVFMLYVIVRNVVKLVEKPKNGG